MLCGWHNLRTDLFRYIRETDCDVEYAFSGIYIIGRKALDALEEYSRKIGKRAFPIMDFFLDKENNLKIGGIIDDNLRVLDIGKPSALESASDFLKNIQS